MKKVCLLIIAISLLQGCMYQRTPVVIREVKQPKSSKSYHFVRKGETLYAISWQYDKDYRDLAKKNHLKPPYHLQIGQRIQIRFPKSKRVKPKKVASKPPIIRRPVTVRLKAKSVKLKPKISQRWSWPTQGKVIQKFSKYQASKGINISGRAGQVIRAAQSGRVAYAGSGIRGYGKLLIIKHNDIYLSAYAHNRELLVKEGAWVNSGQTIARMGNSGSRRVMLHFEIRRRGIPVDPLSLLPKA